jgi:hypothetical protein
MLLQATIEQTREQILKLLTTEWLVSNVLDTGGLSRWLLQPDWCFIIFPFQVTAADVT